MKPRTLFKPIHWLVIAGAISVGWTGLACTKNMGLPAGVPLATATETATFVLPTHTATNTMTSTPVALTATTSSTATLTKTNTATTTMTASPTNSPTQVGANTCTNTPSGTATYTVTETVTSTPTLAPTSIATAMAGASSLNLTTGTMTLNTGIYYYSCVNIGTGASVTINGAVTIFTECFTLNTGATMTGVGKGYAPNTYINQCPAPMGGPGGGEDMAAGCYAVCGGGGHGGAGATVCLNGCCATLLVPPPSLANDDPVHPAYMGSAGGWPGDANQGCTPPAAYGGGLLEVVVYNPTSNKLQTAAVNGTIDMSGSNASITDGNGAPSGSGAGGTILIESSTLTGSGALTANGGSGMGNGGGGGIISLISNTTSFSGTTSVLLANGSQPGLVTTTAPPANGY